MAMNSNYSKQIQNYTYNGNIYTIDLKTNTFRTNYYSENTFTGGSALVDLSSLPRLTIIGEFFENNGDASSEILTYFGSTAYTG